MAGLNYCSMKKHIAYNMKLIVISGLIVLGAIHALSQQVEFQSPNQKISIALCNKQSADVGEWYLKINYSDSGKIHEPIPEIMLGLSRSDQDFSKELKYLKAGKPVLINESYAALHGKRSQCGNSANEMVVYFENPGKARMNVIIRAYNDGVAFCYEFPEREAPSPYAMSIQPMIFRRVPNDGSKNSIFPTKGFTVK